MVSINFIFKNMSWAFLFFMFYFCNCKKAQASDQNKISDSPALQYCINEIEKENREFVVYSDFGDGQNMFTQKALLNPAGKIYPEMDEKAASPYGVTCIHVTYPLSSQDWNGYNFITGRLDAGAILPVHDYGTHQTGYDLRGVKKLTFKARGKTGTERVKFYIGGLGGTKQKFRDSDQRFFAGNSNSFTTLSTEWKEYSMNFDQADLSQIACGFAWVTTQIANPGLDTLEFDFDEIIYHFDTARPLFLRSYETLPMNKPGSFINNFAYIYDNALLAIALAYAGYDSFAKQVADAIVYCMENDRYYQPEVLRNAYANGSPVSFPGWFSEKNKSFALLPGFYNKDMKVWHEDRYAVSINNGVMCWAIEALLAVYDKTHQSKYLESASCMADYIIEHFISNDAIGGFTGGYEGWEGKTEKLTYKSTEHNIDLMSTFKHLSKVLSSSNPSVAAKYLQASNHARSFVLSMYDNGCFYTGTLADGITPNVDNKPLDTHTWAILTLYGDKEVEHLWDPEMVYSFIQQTFKTGEGVDYNQDKDGIWNEGTAQLALAALRLGKTSEYSRLMNYLESVAEPDGSIHAASRNGLSTGFESLIATENGLVSIPWTYDHRKSLASTVWVALAQLKINPYTGEELGKIKGNF